MWWQLILGAAIILLASTGLVGIRFARGWTGRGVLVLRLLLVAVVLIAAAAVVRSFPTA